jgi:four helix bundle protein
MSTFRTLDLSVQFYELSEKSDIKGNLRDQLLRAASSISLNLSEGNAKRTVAEKKRYYHTAYASCQELLQSEIKAKTIQNPVYS